MPPYPGDATELESVDKQVHGAELWLMGAGLLFAVSLSGLIGVDVMGDRGHRPHRLAGAAVRRWRIVALLVALVSFAGGLCLLVGYGQASHVAVGLLAIATLVLLRWRSSHRGRSRSWARSSREAANRRRRSGQALAHSVTGRLGRSGRAGSR